jgi:transposase
VKHAHPTATIEVWAFDEHRVGLKPILRRVWAPNGKRPRAPIRPRYQWLYVDGFVEPTTGRTEWWVMPTVNVACCRQVLAKFADLRGAGPDKEVVLVWDQAGWHRSARVAVPAHVHPVFLPAYSPELQPAERLWPLINEPLANRTVADLDELETTLCARCNQLDEQTDQIRALTQFHWWPTPPANLEPSP